MSSLAGRWAGTEAAVAVLLMRAIVRDRCAAWYRTLVPCAGAAGARCPNGQWWRGFAADPRIDRRFRNARQSESERRETRPETIELHLVKERDEARLLAQAV